MSNRPESAFPHPQMGDYPQAAKEQAVGLIFASAGMSLRDWFAGQALPAIFNGWVEAAKNDTRISEHGGLPTMAERAYEIADAMLQQREKTK